MRETRNSQVKTKIITEILKCIGILLSAVWRLFFLLFVKMDRVELNEISDEIDDESSHLDMVRGLLKKEWINEKSS